MQTKLRSFKISGIAIMLFISMTMISAAQTNRFSISINSTSSNFNYGNRNSELRPFKKDYKGFKVGISFQRGITPSFSLVPEVFFSIKGGTLKEKNPVTINKSTIRLYTIDLPVLARFYLNKFYINAGPYAGYNLGGRLKVAGSESIPGRLTKISFNNASSGFRRIDLGLLAGAGYNFKMKKSILTLDARYGYGFTSLSRDIERFNRMLEISLVVSKRKS